MRALAGLQTSKRLTLLAASDVSCSRIERWARESLVRESRVASCDQIGKPSVDTNRQFGARQLVAPTLTTFARAQLRECPPQPASTGLNRVQPKRAARLLVSCYARRWG